MGWELAPVAWELFDRLFCFFKSENSRYQGIEEQIARLGDIRDQINALLMECEEHRHIQDYTAKNWLRQLKSVFFDSDDLLDSFQTACGMYEHSKNYPSTSSEESPSRKRKWSTLDISFCLPSFGPKWGPLQRRKFGLDIDSITKRFNYIKANQLTPGDSDRTQHEVPCQSIPESLFEASYYPNRKVNRETLKNEIVEILTDDLREAGPKIAIPVVAICGDADIGKTTLAQLVFADGRIRGHFRLKIWVSLTKACDETNATKKIFKKMTNQSCNHDSLDRLQTRLREYLQSVEQNKFLLVIDNVWAEGSSFWDVLRLPLLSGGKGSKVLITTRDETVYENMSNNLHLTKLTGLREEECWDVLQSFAVSTGVHGLTDRLVQIGMEIANKCYGSPLVAKILGATLKTLEQREEAWSNVLVKMQSLRTNNYPTLPGLIISYRNLPYNIKRCIACCCILPNGYLFEKDQVIGYWMAEGLIEVRSSRDLEGEGGAYFEKLVRRSFCEKFNANDKNERERYRIPSLVHDMVRLILGYEFVTQDYGGSWVPQTEPGRAYYASILYQSGQTFKFENASNFGNLRTLILCCESRGPLEKVPRELFAKLTRLRILDFSNSKLTELPSIGGDQLSHLRYIGLSNTLIKKLPESVCQLYNLQTIELGGCKELIELPEGTSKLVNLRRLGFHINWDKITNKNSFPMPHGISKLTHLRTLSRFTVALDSNGKCNICELRNMNRIRGELCISNLENLTDKLDATDANLRSKRFIKKLMLRWSDGCMKPYPMDWVRVVTDALRPNSSLKCLWIVNYPDSELPNWVGEPTFTVLKTVRLSNLSFMPSLGRLPGLKHLYIEKINVRMMCTFTDFPSLKTLTITNMAELEKLVQQQDIPSLQKLEIIDCPNLTNLVIHRNLYPSKFNIQNCPKMPVSSIICIPQD